jgi:PAS domain S-box-containing protein
MSEKLKTQFVDELETLRGRIAELVVENDSLKEQFERGMAELRASEQKWRSITESAPDYVMTVDRLGRIQYINHLDSSLTPNLTPQDVIGTPIYDFVPGEFHKVMEDCFRRVFATGRPDDYEVAYITQVGEVRHFNTRVGPLKDVREHVVALTLCARDITEEKRARDKLKANEQWLRQLLNLQERERKLLAHEIHDGFVQDVIGGKMMLDGVRHHMQSKDGLTLDELSKVSDLLSDAIAEARRMISELRPMIIDEQGIVEAIKFLIAAKEQTGNLTVDFTHEVRFDRIDAMLEGALFRIVQEALTNVQRHGQTNHAWIKLTQEDAKLRLEICDHGAGFDPDDVPPDRFGLLGIRERARLFGGSAVIRSSLGSGTTLLVKVPISCQERTCEM